MERSVANLATWNGTAGAAQAAAEAVCARPAQLAAKLLLLALLSRP